MDLQTLITNAVNQFSATLTKSLKPNEAAAIQQLIQGAVTLIEAEAINRGGPALMAELAAKYPNLAAVIAQIPELKSLLPAA
jgi:DNA-binding transcriptional regulator YbjK